MARSTNHLQARERDALDSVRKTALIAGVFYLVTFASSIPAVFLLGPVLNDPNYIVSAGNDTSVVWGCLLDLINAFACVGTAVALFPVVRRENESLALDFVTARLFEAAVITIGVVSLLAVMTLRQTGAGGGDPGRWSAPVKHLWPSGTGRSSWDPGLSRHSTRCCWVTFCSGRGLYRASSPSWA